jgi:hypothetical protein
MTREYIHPKMDTDIESIGGYYTFEKEAKLFYKGREVLVEFGYGILDKSCCGTAGCRFAYVAGYIISWKSKLAEDGSPVSEIQTIEDEEERSEIKDIIDLTEPHRQVNFL